MKYNIEEIKNSATYKLYRNKGISEDAAIKMIKDVQDDFRANNWKVLFAAATVPVEIPHTGYKTKRR